MHRTVQLLAGGIDRGVRLARRASRHDLVLAVIPAAFLVAALLGAVGPIDATTAVLAGALLSGLAVADALFFNPPRGPAAGGSSG